MTRAILLAACTAVTLVGPVAAEEFQFAPDDSPLYGRFAAGAQYLHLPQVNGFGGSIDDEPYNFIRQPDEAFTFSNAGLGGSVTLGMNLFEAGWQFLGARRAELTLHGYDVSDKNSRSYEGDGGEGPGDGDGEGPQALALDLNPGEYYDVIAIDGQGVIGGYSNDGGVFRVEADAWQLAGDLMLFWDFGPEESFGHWSFGAGMTGGYSSVLYRAGEVNNSLLTTEQATARFIGPQISLDYAIRLDDATTLFLGAKLAGLYMDGELKAKQTGGSMGEGGGGGSARVSDDDTWFAGQGLLSVGLQFDLFGAAVAKIGAEGGYITGVPKIVNPQAGPGDNIQNDTFTPAHLDHGGAWTGTFMVSVSVALFSF